jgi:DNA polymerase I-like protein with 3'-5' exonuclease and polymerase domains
MHKEAINFFPQGSAADILHLATIGLGDWQGVEEYGSKVLIHALLREHFGEYPARVFHNKFKAHIALSMHDSLVVVVPEKHAEACAELVSGVMFMVPRLVIPLIDNPFYGSWPNGWYLPVECEIKERWGTDYNPETGEPLGENEDLDIRYLGENLATLRGR